MEAYSKVAGVFNLPVQLSYRTPQHQLDDVRPMLRHRNRHHGTGRGVKRRDSAELGIRDVQAWLAALLDGRPGTWTVKKRKLTSGAGVYGRRDGLTPGLFQLRAHVRAGVSWLKEHGPASGWGLANADAGGETTSDFTPYYVPTRSRAAAEVWLRVALRVGRVVALFLALLGRVRPTPRGPEAGTAEHSEALPVPSARADYRYGVQVSPSTARGAPPGHRPACTCAPCLDAARFLRATRQEWPPVEVEAWWQRARERSDERG